MAKKRYYSGGWSHYSQYYTASKPIPVDDGITLKSKKGDIGENWWSKRWLEVLYSFAMGERLNRGRSYARKGQVTSINVDSGIIRARVQGSSYSPYTVEIRLEPLKKGQWQDIIAAMASKAIFTAKLLNGEMPNEIESVFTESRLPLFPTKSHDLKTECSCPDYANPCKHIAAVYFILAEKFDEDPFLIFKLRGVSQVELIEQLRRYRNDLNENDNPIVNPNIPFDSENSTEIISQPPPKGKKRKKASKNQDKELKNQEHHTGHGKTNNYPIEGKGEEKPSNPPSKIISMDQFDLQTFWEGEISNMTIDFDFRPPLVEFALLKRLGNSPLSHQGKDFAEHLKEMYADITSRARKRFLNDPANE
jgi:uncharacterized Zn finger protein